MHGIWYSKGGIACRGSMLGDNQASDAPCLLLLLRGCCKLRCLQSYIDGLPVFTESPKLYGWTDGQCGIMLGVLGLSAPFINQGVAGLAKGTSDRILTVSHPCLCNDPGSNVC